MTEVEVEVPLEVNDDTVLWAIGGSIAGSGLSVTMLDTLRSFPGCTHWHLKRGREAGTLEVTYWPQRRRLWFSVHRNRSAPWIEALMPRLRDDLAARLSTREGR